MSYRTSPWRFIGPDLVEAAPVDPNDRAAVIRDRLAEIAVCEWCNSCAYTLSAKVEEANRPLREERAQQHSMKRHRPPARAGGGRDCMGDDEWLKTALSRPGRDAELLAKGTEIALHPLAGWSTATLPHDYVMVAIEFLTPPPDAGARILRLAMTRAQCSEIATVLERLARVPHIVPTGPPN